MLKSMTGFGRCEIANEERKITVEMKAVNHRYCELSVKLPKKLSFYEAGIRNLLKQHISRGKVDVFITYEDESEGKACVRYNPEIAGEYLKRFRQMETELGLENDVSVSMLSRMPEVLVIEEQSIDESELWQTLEAAVRGAAEQLVKTRTEEGERLQKDLTGKLDGMLAAVVFIEDRSPQIVAEYRRKLTEKVNELLGDTRVDEGVLATEITVFADRICVDEETVRLKAHIQSMKEALAEGINIGRKLDFIAQEMNREANTILSKSGDLGVTNRAIDLKTEIEKVREQIQNIE
ncbi:MAG: YicC family protein [Lachnospiraceae bacterium]|nr:YicC family protein [Lachnospiraceae bacterium]